MTAFDFGLFDLPTKLDTHDPGGKVKTALPPGLRGDAVFSECGRYRRVLRRWIGDVFPARHWLLIGMNPSTADATANDPTVTREWGFTVREGYTGFVKCNVGDYRATAPAHLSKPGVVACSPDNLPTILQAAESAERVVVCFGKVPRPLVSAARETVEALRQRGIDLWCFGNNKDGSPKHPLYLGGKTSLVRF
ncbi:DUF1643 domain-containing protein [Azospirillum canadense]|uniref:DUF1643 domain-containing protein n=1 Tax=Azospirillum canadense TaxID=403962 RepID=UPI0022272F06|nr:DUF1643 domain-containing protein [Azospirillum canadense]MCW2242233.1 hypothetical protein [Azospirillum canadense]